MKKKQTWIFLIIGLVIICLVISALTVFFFIRWRNLNSRPLVMIQTPLNHAEVTLGEGLIVHATATSLKGVWRMELWADNLLLTEKQAEPGSVVPVMVLSGNWVPEQVNIHTLTVRAYSKFKVLAQASVQVTAHEPGENALTTHTLQEGETIETLAVEYGTTIDEIETLNQSGGGEFVPGGEVIVPAGGSGGLPSGDFGGTSTGEGAGESTEPAQPDNDIPLGILQTRGIIWPMLDTLEPTAETGQMKIEVLSLSTENSFEGVHCYASLVNNTPRWVPDLDGNQATDESFTSDSSGLGWNIAAYLAGDHAIHFPWPGDEALPIDISCVGIAAGGTDSVRLGRIQETALPVDWGRLQHAVSSGVEGRFSITYKIGFEGKGLDESIASPWNVRIDQASKTLQWDYLDDDEGGPQIDGFAILVDDTFQWVETRSVRQSRLPDQWLTPPCSTTLRFNVVAYRMSYPEGDYSLPSNTAPIEGAEPGSEGCGRTVVVTFEVLEVGEPDGDNHPAYGNFFANDQLLEFDGRPIEGDNFPTSWGMDDNSQTNISNLLHGFGSGDGQVIVELPAGDPNVHQTPLWVGFEIYHGSRKICSGDFPIDDDMLTWDIHETIETEYPYGSSPDWCVVSFSVSLAEGSTSIEQGGDLPLPDLIVQDITVDASSGRPVIHIRNVGQAAWTQQDVNLLAVWPDDEEIGVFSWPNMTIEPGGVKHISHGGLNPVPALGICVLLDPDNLVYEYRDRLVEEGIIGPRRPYCRPLADLSVPQAEFNQEDGSLHIKVQNRGETTLTDADSDGSLINAELLVHIIPPEGRPLTRTFEGINLEARSEMVLEWPMGETERNRMLGGYTLTINPDQGIPEGDYDNNSLVIQGVTRLRIVWQGGFFETCTGAELPWFGYDAAGTNTWQAELFAVVTGGGFTRNVVSMTSPEVELRINDPAGDFWCKQIISDWFEVAGDEVLFISSMADLKLGRLGNRWYAGGNETLSAANDFGVTTLVPVGTDEACFQNGVAIHYPSVGTLGCGGILCGDIGHEGVRQWGPMEARSDDITNYCWWGTTFELYQEASE